jgi:hypothetical protein
VSEVKKRQKQPLLTATHESYHGFQVGIFLGCLDDSARGLDIDSNGFFKQNMLNVSS